MKKIVIKTKEKTFFVASQNVLYCKAAGAYSVIFLINNQEIVTSCNLLNLYKKMEGMTGIFRVGQSFLVNMNHISCILHSTKELELYNSIKIPYTISIKEIEDEFLRMSNRSNIG